MGFPGEILQGLQQLLVDPQDHSQFGKSPTPAGIWRLRARLHSCFFRPETSFQLGRDGGTSSIFGDGAGDETTEALLGRKQNKEIVRVYT